MKSLLEEIPRSEHSSFRILLDPDLRDFYYWHFHPEIELVYINGVDGKRHIGSHQGKYSNGDMAMIGSYIPHLNFDYGVKGDYEKTVLQFDEQILHAFDIKIPEMQQIHELISDARYGIVFNQDIRERVGPMVRKLINYKGFLRFNKVLEILHLLSDRSSYSLLHKLPYESSFYMKQKDRFRSVLNFIENNYHRKLKIAEVAVIANYSVSAFCRYFKQMTKLSFTDFLNNYRIDVAKRLLEEGKTVSEAAFATGFESLSYFNRIFRKVTKVSPSSFKKNL